MAHAIEFVALWLFWAAVIALFTGIAGLGWRKIATRDWSDLVVLEAAVAMGVVVSFIGLIFAIAMPS